MAERIAQIIGLDICGIDIMASDLRTSLFENGGAVLEVNAAPGFRMHVEPSVGIAQKCGRTGSGYALSQRCTGRIPIIAITGTNGKTTTTRLTAISAKLPDTKLASQHLMVCISKTS